MRARYVDRLALIALLVGGCGDAASSADVRTARLTVVVDEDLAPFVDHVEVLLWEPADAAAAEAPALLGTAEGHLSNGLGEVDILLPRSVARADAECQAFNRGGQLIGDGQVAGLAVDGTAVQPPCAIARRDEIEQAGTVDRSMWASLSLLQLDVAPEPADCGGDTIGYDLLVSDPGGSSFFTMYATGDEDRIRLPGKDEQTLRGRLTEVSGLRATAAGERHTVDVMTGDLNEADGHVNLWLIGTGSQGLVIRNRTQCADGTGEHDLTVLPVPYFYTDRASFTFEVVHGAEGDALTWSCDTDLDGAPDLLGTVPHAQLLAADVTGPGRFDLLVARTGASDAAPTRLTADCGL